MLLIITLLKFSVKPLVYRPFTNFVPLFRRKGEGGENGGFSLISCKVKGRAKKMEVKLNLKARGYMEMPRRDGTFG